MENKSNKKSIFIAIAPNHISNFENIIRNSSNINFTILLNPGNFKHEKSLWSEVINGELDLKYSQSKQYEKVIYQLKKLIGYRSYINKVDKLISRQFKYDFYYCNLDDVLTNHMFHFLNKKEMAFDNYVVEDGILNYYYPEINTTKLKAKKFFCENILGINFTLEKVHPTRIHSDTVKAQYVRLPQKAICPEKSITLPFVKIDYTPLENVTLIIGQDIMHNNKEGSDYYKKRLSALFKRIAETSSNLTKIVYKPHRNGNSTIAENILQYSFNNFEIFKDITPIEECIIKIKPSKIFSFESSAILNLKIAMNRRDVYFAVLPYNCIHTKTINTFKDLEIDILQ